MPLVPEASWGRLGVLSHRSTPVLVPSRISSGFVLEQVVCREHYPLHRPSHRYWRVARIWSIRICVNPATNCCPPLIRLSRVMKSRGISACAPTFSM